MPFDQSRNRFVDLRVEFRHFFVRKLMFVRYASAFVVFPGGYGTLDELFEALTLIQTGKIRHFPVVLAGDSDWQLADWLRQRLLAAGRIFPADLDLVHEESDPVRIRRIVEAAHGHQADEYRAEGSTA